MAPLPEHNTPRFFVDYEGPAGQHTLMFRFSNTTAVADQTTRAQAIVGALKALVPSTVVFNGARYALQGSNVTLPTPWTPVVGINAGALVEQRYPSFLSWVGRSADGRRTRVTLHGVSGIPDTDYRVLATEDAGINAVLTQLKTGTPMIRSISDGAIFWNEYANAGYNAHFQRKRRLVA